MWKPVGLLLAACALLASLLVHDRESHRGIVVDDATASLSAPAPKAPAKVAPKAVAGPVTIAVPADTAARAKFALEDPQVVDKLAFVNRMVNAWIVPEDDAQHYGVTERFVSWPVDRKGDCEDVALSKWEFLGNAGWPLAGTTRLETVIIGRTPAEMAGHVVLEVLLPQGAVMILDSNNDEPMTRSELEAAGYHFFDWRA